jgi:hypothetical protein
MVEFCFSTPRIIMHQTTYLFGVQSHGCYPAALRLKQRCEGWQDSGTEAEHGASFNVIRIER